MTTIREATREDVPRLVEMAQAFLAATPYGVLLPATTVGLEEMIDIVLRGEHPDGSLSVCYVAELQPLTEAVDGLDASGVIIGMIAGSVTRHRYSGLKVGEEIVWWVDVPHRRRSAAGTQLIAALESWTTRNGASVLKMVAPAGSDVATFLKAWGYTPLEEVSIKRL